MESPTFKTKNFSQNTQFNSQKHIYNIERKKNSLQNDEIVGKQREK
jgi:hypothetical protein